MKRLTLICLGVVITLASFVLVPAQEPPAIVKGGLLNGRAVSLPKPAYPVDAKTAGIKGRVVIDVIVDESGSVISAAASDDNDKTNVLTTATGPVTESTPAVQSLLRAAEEAALEAKFAPTRLSGVPVRVSGRIVYNFVLDDSISILEGGVVNEKATTMPMPVYPDAAKAVRASGTVVVRITIDENGDVVTAAAASGHPLLRAAAVEAAREAKFPPTRLRGQPVKVSGVLTYNFIAPDKD